jgi:formylglycine-generating enzyme required for sulfatase activity
MKFLPAGTPGVLFCTCPTRLKEFRAFIDATKYVPTPFSSMCTAEGEKGTGGSWLNPGFVQGPDHPVVAINWDDAEAFCKWLTGKERQAGTISNAEQYRLPTYAEWKTAQGTTTYSWGNVWPPPTDAANVGRAGDGWTLSTIAGTDGYQFTSPVGSFKPNVYGLYDMDGNVYQWAEDYYRVEGETPDMARGFRYTLADKGKDFHQELGTGFHVWGEWLFHIGFHRPLRFPREGSYSRGFRCVLVSQ